MLVFGLEESVGDTELMKGAEFQQVLAIVIHLAYSESFNAH